MRYLEGDSRGEGREGQAEEERKLRVKEGSRGEKKKFRAIKGSGGAEGGRVEDRRGLRLRKKREAWGGMKEGEALTPATCTPPGSAGHLQLTAR